MINGAIKIELRFPGKIINVHKWKAVPHHKQQQQIFLVDLLLEHGPELHIPGQLLGASIQQRKSPAPYI